MDIRELIREELTSRTIRRKIFSKDEETIEKEYGTQAVKNRLALLRDAKSAPLEYWFYCPKGGNSKKRRLIIAPPVFMALILGEEIMVRCWLPEADEDQMIAGIIHPDRRKLLLEPFAYCCSFMDLAAIYMPLAKPETIGLLWERFLDAVQLRNGIPEPDTTWYCSYVSAFHFERVKADLPDLFVRLLYEPHIASLTLESAAPFFHFSPDRIQVETLKEIKGLEYDFETYKRLWTEKTKYAERFGMKRIRAIETDLLSDHVGKWKEYTQDDYVICTQDKYAVRQVKTWFLDLCRMDGNEKSMNEYRLRLLQTFVNAVRFDGSMSWRNGACVCENVIRINNKPLLEKMIRRNYFSDRDMSFLLRLAKERGVQDLLPCLSSRQKRKQ